MSRADELHKYFEGIDEGKRAIVNNLIDEAVYLETQLAELKKYPPIKTRMYNGELQTKITAAGKQYREYLQTYVNLIDKLCKYYSNEEIEDDSPLRAFLNGLAKNK
jgi:hypothetical protein